MSNQFSLLSLELLLVVIVIMTYTYFRKKTVFSLAMVQGLEVCIPPTQADFDTLVDSIKPAGTNAKGKRAKFEKKSPKQARFPLRQMQMGTELLQYCNDFFPDFDFILMLFHYCLCMFVPVLLMKMLLPGDLTQTNLTFYMTMITLMLVLSNLRKGSFPAGYTRLTDETKVQLLFAFKSFIIVWCALVYSDGAVEQFLGLDIAGHHTMLVRKVNQIFALGGNKINLAPEFTYSLFGLSAAALSFLVVKQNVNFAFYFFVTTRTASKESSSAYLEAKSEGKRFTFKQLVQMLYVNFLAPLFVTFLYLHEVSGSVVMSVLGISELSWQIIRLMLILVIISLRLLIFREELQFAFDQSYYIISRMIQDEVEKTEDTFLYVKARVTQNFRETWYTIFQTATNFMIPVLLVLCTLHRIVAFSNVDKQMTDFDFSSTITKLRENETLIMESGEPYYLLHDKEQISIVMGEISGKGLIPFEYQVDFFSFCLFWYFFSSFLVQSFALLYYRKYREN